MAEFALIDPTLCTNPDAPGECCGGSFDYKASPGLCAFIHDWPQCTGCSAQLKLLKAPRCGACKKKDTEATNLASPEPTADATTKTLQTLQAENCRNAMVARTLQKGTGSRTPAPGSAPHQAGIAKGASRQITVYLVPMTSNGNRIEAPKILAGASRAFPEDMTMTVINLLRHWNLDWEKHCSESLTPEHVSLRLLGNLGIEPHSILGTLGKFFDTHERVHGTHPKKILQGPTNMRLPTPAIYLEGLILVQDFEAATGTLAPYFVHTEKENRKRKNSQTNRGSESGLTKRTRSQASTPLPMRSEFGDLPGFSKVDIVFASVSVANNGAVTIKWPDLEGCEATTTSTCLLQDTPFDQGKTKMVYKVIIDGLPWVAKRFFDIGAGEGQVDIQENHDELVNEGTRLARTSYFLGKFIAEAKQQDVEIQQGIHVTDFKLGIELVEDVAGPSAASGFSLEQYQAAHDPGIIVWLFEPRRSSKVKRWSGTNEYPAWNQNKLGSTLNAFSHYAYLFSQESTVLADLQTTAIDEQGQGIEVLFDVMTHTLNGASGVGDHGKPGIQTFLDKHDRDGFSSEGDDRAETSDEE
ncbi:kinase-like domain-containing protein [Mycena crocata]|nr:kinase-like domain-containing protein [Mycena crocata]